MVGQYTIGSPSIKRFYQADGYYRDRERKMIIGWLLVRIVFVLKGIGGSKYTVLSLLFLPIV